MSVYSKVLPCGAIIAVALFLGDFRLIGQSLETAENERSVRIAGAGTTLPIATARMYEMLRLGELDIESGQSDTMIVGRVHERLKQTYKGLPVFGGQLVRQMDGRSVISVAGRIYNGIELDVMPKIAAAKAVSNVLSNLGTRASVNGEVTLGVKPIVGGKYTLVYRFNVRNGLDARIVDVDANSGEVIQSITRLRTIESIGQGTGVLGDLKKVSSNSVSSIFEASDRFRPAPILTLDFKGNMPRLVDFFKTGVLHNADIATDIDNVWNDAAVVDAHVYQGWTYDFYFKNFGRRGIDDANSPIVGIVHPLLRADAALYHPDDVNTFIDNALWLGDLNVMMYGDGTGVFFNYLAGSLDVIAHELSHGVTQHSSDLIYLDEPGALNEAFSDIMGAAAEFYFQPFGSGPNRGDWLIGEDTYRPHPGFLRSLNNPIAAGCPDHYALRQFIGTETDNGGVHINSMIAGHAFYLAVMGGRNRFSGIEVLGVGQADIQKMAKIFYRGFVFLLGPSSNFSDARAATLQAATDLYGAASNERTQLEQAWTAVGVH
jgi:Zn-dependent metalloprotease